jgi:peptidoglycan/LPS O-acetylase OafA/YrhL
VLCNHVLLPNGRWFDQWKIGTLGVDLFFAISGLLITYRCFSTTTAWARSDLRSFYLRRVFRILPAAMLFLMVVAILGMSGIVASIAWKSFPRPFLPQLLPRYDPVELVYRPLLVALSRGAFLPALACSAVLILTLLHPTNVISRVLEMAPFRLIGKISCGVYLWQIAIAWFWYKFFEEPLRRCGAGLASRPRAAVQDPVPLLIASEATP